MIMSRPIATECITAIDARVGRGRVSSKKVYCPWITARTLAWNVRSQELPSVTRRYFPVHRAINISLTVQWDRVYLGSSYTSRESYSALSFDRRSYCRRAPASSSRQWSLRPGRASRHDANRDMGARRRRRQHAVQCNGGGRSGGRGAGWVRPPRTGNHSPLPDAGQWDALEAAREAMLPNYGNQHPVERYSTVA